uniref:SWIM-type domain-containing protein n=3 Tax=Cacopsylla melanoneura TaxID=428564 RepID=A0A8D9FFV0_9HEMI
MHFIRDQLFSRIISSTKGKVSSKIADIRKAHSLSLSEKLCVSKMGEIWEVLEGKNKQIVTQAGTSCSCQLICGDCRVCIHKYVCTCYTSTIKWNMCKHIHAVAKSDISSVEEDPTLESDRSHVVEAILPSIVEPVRTVEGDIGKIRASINSILQSVTTVQQTSLILKSVSKLQGELELLLQNEKQLGPDQPEVKNTGKKRKISPQRRLLPIKKKQCKKAAKNNGPTRREVENIKSDLILSLL